MIQQKWRTKHDSSRKLFTVYGKLRNGKLRSLNQGYCGNEDDVKDLIIETYKALPKRDRKKYARNYIARQVQKTNSSVASAEILAEASILETPKEDRIKKFGAAIIDEYKSGAALYKLNKKYGVSLAKIREFLINSEVSIRARGQRN